ncbi:MarR family winged helix-turn-helix transcriptional regulator [Candidatus Omnitrophota bacterium]
MSIFRELGIRSGKDRLNEEVVYNIARSYVYVEQAISNFLTKYNLSSAKFNILLMAKHRGEDKGLPQREISRLLLVTTSNITRMVDKLEKESYVERLAKEGDRRVNLIKITEKGATLLDEIWPHYKVMVDKLVASPLSAQDKLTIISLLEKFKCENTENKS